MQWTMKDTHMYFLSKYKQEFPHENVKCIMTILLNHRKLFIKWKKHRFALIKLKGNNITPYYLPYI